jgi:hypothetical protein
MEKEEALFSLMNLEFGNVFLGLESICPEPGDVYLAPSPLCVCPAMMILNFTFQLRRFQCRRSSVRKLTKKIFFLTKELHLGLKNILRISCEELMDVWVQIIMNRHLFKLSRYRIGFWDFCKVEKCRWVINSDSWTHCLPPF